MSKKKSIIGSSAEYVRSYEKMHGVNFSAEKDSNGKRYAYLENMYVDYATGSDTVESIPGYRRLYSFGDKINGIFRYSDADGITYCLVHSGSTLYRFKQEDIAVGVISPETVGMLADAPSKAFCIGNTLYILDGSAIFRLTDTGVLTPFCEGDRTPYVPTLRENGVTKEQRNLLTNEFIIKQTISSPQELVFGTSGLIYRIISESQATCAVVGCGAIPGGMLHIPSYARINGKRYTVTEIAKKAFRSRADLYSLVTNRGLLTVGDSAFEGCTSMRSAVISGSVTRIGTSAFASCSALMLFYMGESVDTLGEGVLSGCAALQYVNYNGDSADFASITGHEHLAELTKSYNTSYGKLMLSIPLHEEAKQIISVKLAGKEHAFSSEGMTGSVLIELSESEATEGTEISVRAEFADGAGGGFFDSPLFKATNALEAILTSTVYAVYEGHLFLSGSALAPGVVFFSDEKSGMPNPLYFPADNYFVDGAANAEVVSLLPSLDSLSVHTANRDGGESIFIHTPKKDGNGDKFPLYEAIGGVVNFGATLGVAADSLFLCSLGVTALERVSGKSYIEPKTRSSNIQSMLMGKDLTEAKLALWGEYIVLLVGEHIYLGDTRATFSGVSGREYEWYCLKGVGEYENDTRVYRYASCAPDGYCVSESPDEAALGEIMSVVHESGELVYYVIDGGRRLTVYPTEEFKGGDFYPPCAILGGENLLFGTTRGGLYAFNCDKRGVPPKRIAESADFNAKEYEAAMGNKIHPDFYDFAGHAPRYALRIASDDCGIPHLAKSTVRGSFVIKCKNFERGLIRCEVGTDKESFSEQIRFSGEKFGFESLDFAGFSSSTREFSTVAVPDGSRGWIEKEISLYSDEFRSPMGVYSISYRYKIKGRIK